MRQIRHKKKRIKKKEGRRKNEGKENGVAYLPGGEDEQRQEYVGEDQRPGGHDRVQLRVGHRGVVRRDVALVRRREEREGARWGAGMLGNKKLEAGASL